MRGDGKQVEFHCFGGLASRLRNLHCGELSSGALQFIQELLLVKRVFERLLTVNKDDRNLFLELLIGFVIFEDIYLAQVESMACLQHLKLCFKVVAQAAAGLGINHHFGQGLNWDSRG
jgi:hypothetical protein